MVVSSFSEIMFLPGVLCVWHKKIYHIDKAYQTLVPALGHGCHDPIYRVDVPLSSLYSPENIKVFLSLMLPFSFHLKLCVHAHTQEHPRHNARGGLRTTLWSQRSPSLLRGFWWLNSGCQACVDSVFTRSVILPAHFLSSFLPFPTLSRQDLAM